ncbi:MAG TPA: hypothetical protein DCL21_01630 [Alphaproteobacteria bacterium]|nr:hypothetical protein [Alphaproteobacteria bacterium]
MVFVGNRESITVCEEKVARNTLGDFATDGYYIGSEPVMSDFNENARGFKSRISVEGGNQRETMDSGAELHQFTLKWIITDFKFVKFFLAGLVEAGSDPYTHTFDLETSKNYNFFSLQRKLETGIVHTYKGCAIRKLKVEFQKATGDDEQGYIRVTANVVATSFDKTQALITVPDSATKDIFTFSNFKATIGGVVRNEVISGSIDIDAGTNPEDYFYANSDNDSLIGEVAPVFFKSVGNFVINVKDNSLVDEWNLDGITGTNKFEISRGVNDNIVFNLRDMFNLQPFAPTEYKAITKANVVYDTTITDIVVTDSVENY